MTTTAKPRLVDPKPEAATANRSRRPAKVERLSRPERVARGKAARQQAPLDSHAEFVTDGRGDPIELLESQAVTRVPELVPIRYGRMLASPFAFYRGAALSWPPTWRGRRARACTRSCAATPT